VLATVVDLGEVARVLHSIDPVLALAAAGIVGLDRALMAFKWLLLLRVQLPEATFAASFRSYLLANFASQILPLAAGAEVLRAVSLGRTRGAIVETGASILVERLLGLVGTGLLALAGLVLALERDSGWQLVFPLAVGVVVLGAGPLLAPLALRRMDRMLHRFEPLLGRRSTSVLRRLSAAWGLYHEHRLRVAWAAVLSAFEQYLPVASMWLLARALDLHVDLAVLVITLPLVFVIERLSVGVAGLGVTEAALVYLLGLSGIPSGGALALGLAARAVHLLVVLPGAAFWLDLVRTSRRG
jgi:uncharacterized protein (TIRG00374 family)